MRSPKTVMSDLALKDAVMTELEWDPRVNPAGIGVSARDGAIALTGHVASFAEKWAAVRAAERVYGVKAVADDIDVTLSASVEHKDAEIAAEIARQRSWSTLIPNSVTAEVAKGHVTLHGNVEWSYQRAEAERAVRHLWGVRGVTNSITVEPRVEPDAADVARRVEEAIERMADLDARSIWVTTSGGTVHLHGHVHSLAERRIAAQAAESAPGVTTVENDLDVNL